MVVVDPVEPGRVVVVAPGRLKVVVVTPAPGIDVGDDAAPPAPGSVVVDAAAGVGATPFGRSPPFCLVLKPEDAGFEECDCNGF